MPDTTRKTSPAPRTAYWYKQYTLPLAVAVLLIFHAVGVWGLLYSSDPASFQRLTPMNLLLTNALLFGFHRNWNKAFLLFAVVVASTGFLAEVLGVHTGLLFGNYSYGAALGPKLWEVPLLIGLNWLMLVYSTGHISNLARLPWLAKAGIGALLMVVLDYFIEPVAMQYDFWSWQAGHIPVSNFVGWFGVALLLQVYFQKASFFKHNKIAPWVYLVQLLFFICLYSTL
ncbi:carotenoid biosynthesis protein [Pontibacter sp. E15-1]|uniref:carotenoid biosynthesis protein n=1 Tax=Pontibacter sp. E15-1 TaxID=2919918 RepID=UPI001F4FD49B|nr:carotenoid biosynthesis protein [Pontibacter sp. E15-1]MCJ8163836.1 carotenoid biosynthesis protein [Pontibacter sp. E15-1]